jgi:hypothetical protein
MLTSKAVRVVVASFATSNLCGEDLLGESVGTECRLESTVPEVSMILSQTLTLSTYGYPMLDPARY